MLMEDYRVDAKKRPQGVMPILGEIPLPYIPDYSHDW